ncbi:MAG TPA: SiaB family protein kinase [Bacteroidia bacterium]|nr:SiaB family protein kinase [Bacteroidia bacterium]
MSDNTHTEEAFFKSHFLKTIDSLKNGSEVLLAYDGVLNVDTISRLETEVEGKVTALQIPKGPLKKIFFISVEALQNMLIHGGKDEMGHQHNYFILSKNHAKVEIITSNLVPNGSIERLKGDVERLNSFNDPADLKNYYMEHLEKNEISDKGGAGLGFITIAMKSGNKLGYEFDKISDKLSLFLLKSTVNLE